MAGLEIRVLGKPTVHVDGAALVLPKRKAFSLLLALALDGPSSREALAALLWEKPRELGLLNLRAALHVLRQALGPHAPVLMAQRDVIALDPGRVWTDARQVDSAGPEELLDLWRGPVLDGLRVRDSAAWDDWVSRWSTTLTAQYVERVRELAEEALRDQRTETAFQLASRAWQVDPLSERVAALFQRVGHASGRHAEALQAARTFRREFVREFGVAPESSPEEPPTSLADPLSESGATLPLPLTGFVGRRRERQHLLNWLGRESGRLLTLCGPGGVGKTRLATEVAREALRRGQVQEAYFVSLLECTQPQGVAGRILDGLGVAAFPGEGEVAALQRVLGRRPVLLVLDNAEHLLGGVSLLCRLLQAIPGLTLLVTSRERLSLSAERVVPLDGLPRAEAAQLFAERAGAVSYEFGLDAQNLAQVQRICELVGGIPLAIELAAAWTGTLPLAGLVQQLERDAVALHSPFRDTEPRHRSLQDVFEQSWQRLGASEQEGLMRLAVLAGGFTGAAAQGVAGLDAPALRALEGKALLRYASPRFSFHPLVREGALAKLRAFPQRLAGAYREHAAYFLAEVQRLGGTDGQVSPELLAFLSAEDPDIVLMLWTLLGERRWAEVARVEESLFWSYPLRGRFMEGLALWEKLASSLRDEPPGREVRVAFLVGAAWLHLLGGEVGQAQQRARQALALLPEAEAGAGAPPRLLRLRTEEIAGKASFRAHLLPEAHLHLGRALALARELPDAVRRMRALNHYGVLLALRDDPEGAAAHLREARALFETGQVSPGMEVVWLLSNTGVACLVRGDLLAAAEWWRAGTDLATEVGASGQVPTMLALRAFAELELALEGGPGRNLTALEQQVEGALQTLGDVGEHVPHALLLALRGRLLLERGGHHAGLPDLFSALAQAWDTQNVTLFQWLLPYAIDGLIRQGDRETAGELLGFLRAHGPVGRWTRARAERASAGHQDDEAWRVAVGRGQRLSLSEVGLCVTGLAARQKW